MGRQRAVFSFPQLVSFGASGWANTHDPIDAAGEKVLMFGRVAAWHWRSGTKSITGVKLVAGTVTQGTGTTTVRVGLADPHATAGPPVQDDGVLDQSGTLALTSISTAAPFEVTLGSARTVNRGDEVCVVVDFSAFGTGPVLTLRAYLTSSAPQRPSCSSYIGVPAWVTRNVGVNVALLCSDGTTIYLDGFEALLFTGSATADYSSATTGATIDTGDERGSLWVPRKPWLLEGGFFNLRSSSSAATAEIVLYRDDTVLWSEAVNPYQLAFLSSLGNYYFRFASPIAVYPGENIRLTLRATNTTVAWRVQRAQFATVADVVSLLGAKRMKADCRTRNGSIKAHGPHRVSPPRASPRCSYTAPPPSHGASRAAVWQTNPRGRRCST